MSPFAQVTYQPPPAPQHVQRPVNGSPEVKSRNSIRLPLRAWTTSWWMLGFGVAGAALGVAGDDEVVRVLADPDRVVGGAEVGAVPPHVEDEVDGRRVAVPVAAAEVDRVVVAGVRDRRDDLHGQRAEGRQRPGARQGLVVVITVPGAGVVSGATVSARRRRGRAARPVPRAKNDRNRLEPAWVVVTRGRDSLPGARGAGSSWRPDQLAGDIPLPHRHADLSGAPGAERRLQREAPARFETPSRRVTTPNSPTTAAFCPGELRPRAGRRLSRRARVQAAPGAEALLEGAVREVVGARGGRAGARTTASARTAG